MAKVVKLRAELSNGDYVEISPHKVATNIDDPSQVVDVIWDKFDRYKSVREALDLYNGQYMNDAVRRFLAAPEVTSPPPRPKTPYQAAPPPPPKKKVT